MRQCDVKRTGESRLEGGGTGKIYGGGTGPDILIRASLAGMCGKYGCSTIPSAPLQEKPPKLVL